MMKRIISNIFRAFTLGILMLLQTLAFGAEVTYAHGGGVLTVTPDAAAPGETITIAAEGVEAGETFTIHLLGLSFEGTLGTVTVGDDEDFHEDFIVPNDAPPGSYQVQATSEEGETLTAEFTILEGASQSLPPTKPGQPSAAPMELERTRPAGVWIAILGGILISASAGWTLVRGRD